MAFNVYGAGQKESGNSEQKQVDFDQLHKYVVETAGLQNRETLVGYVSMIVDLGTQKQADAEMEFKGSAEDEAKAIADKPATYFKNGTDQNGKPVRLKCWPQKPIQCVAVAVDFPDILLDKGQFFGGSNPLPLRLWLGGQFILPVTWADTQKMVVARPTPLKVNKSLGNWSFDQKHLFYKMAVADKIIKPGEVFLPQDIDKLLGRAFQFEAQVFFKPSKDGSKQYYTEYIKFVSGLGRGQAQPKLLTQPLLIQMDEQNDPKAVKELSAHVLNTCKNASNYEGSVFAKQVAEIRGGNSKPAEKQQEVAKPAAKTPTAAQVHVPDAESSDEDFEDDVPFN